MNKETGYGGIGFIGLLTIVFIVLKLTGTIGWSWIWVLSPLWIDVVLVVITIAIMVLIRRRKNDQ